MQKCFIAVFVFFCAVLLSEVSFGGGVTIAEGDNTFPAGTKVLSDGKPVWPPKGEGCDKLIKCCMNAAKEHSDAGLMCQLSLVSEKGNCPLCLTKVNSYLKERGYPVITDCR